jgi:mRNA-degrading endonuclease toxin of MazEF toxin-antitoxin module
MVGNPRYTLVIAAQTDARLALASVVLTTKQSEDTPYEVRLPPVPWLREQSYINVQSIQSVKLTEFVRKAPGKLDARVISTERLRSVERGRATIPMSEEQSKRQNAEMPLAEGKGFEILSWLANLMIGSRPSEGSISLSCTGAPAPGSRPEHCRCAGLAGAFASSESTIDLR